MSDAETGDVVVRRTPVNRHENERRSRPDSSHKGNLKRLKTSSVSGFQRWEKENELLWAMLEDETEWLAKLFPDIVITPEIFFYALEDGVVLCRLANRIQEKAEEFGKKNKVKVPGKKFKFHTEIQKKNKQLALFKSRENVQGFLTWCRQLGISDSILFESNDIVEADECREGCREVVICLMEIARRAAGRFKFAPIPKLIQLEKEIEAEEQQEEEETVIDEVEYIYGSSDDDTDGKSRSPNSKTASPPMNGESSHSTPGKNKKKPKRQHPKSELDHEVYKIIDNFNFYNIRKLKEGKYIILGKTIFVRMLNGHVLLRIGGGWDTLEHYLMTHIPKAAAEDSEKASEPPVAPSVSKTPQKSQLTKLLDKVKKEQQLKATPASSPYRAAAKQQQDDSSGDDEKDITSAIRKIEFSVNQNIATRRKHSKVNVEGSSQKSPTSPEGNENFADLNQNNIGQQHTISDNHLNKSPEKASCSAYSSNKMDGETCATESGFSERKIGVNGEMDFGSAEQNGAVGEAIELEGSAEDGDSEMAGSSEVDGLVADQTVDTVDGGIVTKPRESPDVIVSEDVQSEDLKSGPNVAQSLNGVELENELVSREVVQANDETSQSSCEIQQPESLASIQLPQANDGETSPSSPDNAASADDATGTSDEPAPAAGGDGAPTKPASPSLGKKGAVSPKRAASPTKGLSKTKQPSGKSVGTKKEAPGSTAARPKSAHPKTRPGTADTTAAKSKRPTSAVSKTTTSAAKTSTLATKPSSTSGSSTTNKKSSATHSALTKKPASKTENKPVASTKPARPVSKTTAFGSTGTKPAPKKPADGARPATAPPARTAQAKGKQVAAKVQTGLSSSRPQSARPAAKPATAASKDSTGGGAASKQAAKGPGKQAKEAGAARDKSPTKPLVRKTQTRTVVTTVKTRKSGANSEPEVKSQTIKSTTTVTEANGKKTTKTTVKEIAPAGRKPLRMTKTETTDTAKGTGKKAVSTSTGAKTGTRTAKKPESKSGVGSAGRAGTVGASKATKGPGTKKSTETVTGGHLKGTVPKAKTVKELSNALGINKPDEGQESTTAVPDSEPKAAEEKAKVAEEETQPSEAPIATDKAETPTDDRTTPVEGVATPPDEGTPSTDEATSTPDQPTTPTDEATTPADKTSPTDETTAPTNEEKSPSDEMTPPTEGITIQPEEAATPTDDSRIPTEQTTVRADDPTSPSEDVKEEEVSKGDVQDVIPEESRSSAERTVDGSEEEAVEQENESIVERVEDCVVETEPDETILKTEAAEVVEGQQELVNHEAEKEGYGENEAEASKTLHDQADDEIAEEGAEEKKVFEQDFDDGENTREHKETDELLEGSEVASRFAVEQPEPVGSGEEHGNPLVEEPSESAVPEDSGFVDGDLPKENEGQTVQEVLEDSLDVIYVPADDVHYGETKSQRTEAWQAVDQKADDQKEHASSLETGGERPDGDSERAGKDKDSSTDSVGSQPQGDVEDAPEDERPPIVPHDPDVPLISPQESFETDRNTEQTDVDSYEDNNNLLEERKETELQSDPDVQPASSDAGQVRDYENPELLVLGDTADLDSTFEVKLPSIHGNEITSTKESKEGSPAAVDDLLG